MVCAGLLLAVSLAAGSRIAVMPIAAGEAITPTAAVSFTDALAAEVRRQSGFQVITSRDLAGLLSLEKQKQAMGCSNDMCMAEIAGALGTDRVVLGEVSKLGESLLLHLRMIEARSARVVATSDRRFRAGTFDDLLDALPAMVGELLATEGKPATASPVALTTTPARSPNPEKAVLHYRRRDARYDNVRVAVWESGGTAGDLRKPQRSIVPEGGQSAILPPSTSHLPLLEPTGRDDFGVFWVLPTSQFRNGRVNFVLSVGSGWDECGARTGRFWILQDGREAWYLGVPDCEVYTELETAKRASAGK